MLSRADCAVDTYIALAWHSRENRRTERYSAAQDAASQPHCLGSGAAGLERAPEAGAEAPARHAPRWVLAARALQLAFSPLQCLCRSTAVLLRFCAVPAEPAMRDAGCSKQLLWSLPAGRASGGEGGGVGDRLRCTCWLHEAELLKRSGSVCRATEDPA